MPYRILAINPGSTSTKISVFEGESELFTETLRHTSKELSPFNNITDQYEFRKSVIVDSLSRHNILLDSLSNNRWKRRCAFSYRVRCISGKMKN